MMDQVILPTTKEKGKYRSEKRDDPTLAGRSRYHGRTDPRIDRHIAIAFMSDRVTAISAIRIAP
jgi:hypothetical protein